jgi:hypothetical protein
MLAHHCAVLQIPFDSGRLFGEPYGNYALGLSLVVAAVSETNRQEAARAQHEAST